MNPTLLRTITAFLLLVLVVAIWRLWGAEGFKTVALLAVLIMQTEYVQLTFKDFAFGTRFFICSIYFLVTYVVCFLPGHMIFWEALTLSGILASILFMVRLKHLAPADQLKKQGLFFLGLFYVSLLPSLTILILDLEHGPWILFCALVVIFASDVFAYFIGRKWGDKKLYPAISPNKSWAGAWGGLFGALCLGVALLILSFNLTPPLLPKNTMVIISFLICCIFGAISAQAGDLFESLVKRAADQKDSGKLLPGHGGFLDRFDALMFGLPFFYWFAKFINYHTL